MLSKPEFVMSLEAKQYAATAVPSYRDWQQLWASWDLVSRKMIPEEELLSKPIKLRNCCLFYLGHIPTFLDIHLTRCTDGKLTPPELYPSIFERGIDPDVDNPEQCHDHSEIPDEWPPVEEVLQYQEDVRKRVKSLYDENAFEKNTKLRRVLNLTFEHEVMHLETFLYMLLQSEQARPPPGPLPDFAALAEDANVRSVPNKWFKIPASTLSIGRDDDEHNYDAGHFFGWDNESPARTASVPDFEAQGRPLTNADYAKYMVAKGLTSSPASWTDNSRPDSGYGSRHSPSRSEDGEATVDQEAFDHFVQGKAVRTVYGPVPLKYALDWPVQASYDELAGCAGFFGGRIPTLEEARSIYNFAEQQLARDLGQVPSQTIPAVNGHLSNNGVHQTPPDQAGSSGDGAPVSLSETAAEGERKELFADLLEANVGFAHFHPMPISHEGGRLAGLGEMGGVWEWTSSPLVQHQGFKAMDLYPGYTADFFDGKHNVVLGGSWATHPRVAGRKTFVNWYQRNYPYAWAGARLVRDV